ALVMLRLHLDIILGMNFLVLNRIIVNAEAQTMIAKDTGCDLLHPPMITTTPPVKISIEC
ncbi:hypothetical protein P691DRAFT_658010, partial [Macrolepiota fuliginosa MF-IS2]